MSAAMVAVLGGCCSLCCHDLAIIVQPEDQTVNLHSNAEFSVVVVQSPPISTNGISYQWQVNYSADISLNSSNWVNISGATNASVTINDVGLSNVGHYRVKAWASPPVTSDAASLSVATVSAGGGGTSITVFGAPSAVAGNSSPETCPGAYAGSVSYKKKASEGWGWAPGVAPFIAADGVRTDTKVEMSGYSGDRQCDIFGNCTRTSLPDVKYRFTIYFPTSVPTTNAYPIVLTGFQL